MRQCSVRRPENRRVSGLLLVSALALLPAGPAHAITFTEVHYFPPGAPAERDKLKFIEILNDGPTTVDLSGYHFGEGVVFELPAGTLLGGRKYLVICADEQATRSRYGITNTIANFTGGRSDNGDMLAL